VSGGLALLRAFYQLKIEHQVGKCRLCERLDTEVAGREKDAGGLYESSYRQ